MRPLLRAGRRPRHDSALNLSASPSAQACYLTGLRGALCDEPTRDILRRAGDEFDWSAVAAVPG